MTEKTDKCANPECNCPSGIDSEYCSEYCERVVHDPEAGCRCGHVECIRVEDQPTF
ncbi:MAG: hypothetical protein AB7H86_19720 [Blastocatellales bacterium]